MEWELNAANIEVPRDLLGREIREGNTVVRPTSINKSGSTRLEVQKVTRVDGTKVFLNGSRTPIKLLHTLAVVEPVVR